MARQNHYAGLKQSDNRIKLADYAIKKNRFCMCAITHATNDCHYFLVLTICMCAITNSTYSYAFILKLPVCIVKAYCENAGTG